ncbi:MAG: aminodeoxychorismate synthase component I [Candidatus Omnitrophota bacterium]|nr:aminodeoxychorismate synthase component I [Candidatus Omnitrophota bacterium]
MAYCTWKSYKLKPGLWQIFSRLQEKENCFFLDSGIGARPVLGRYSFLGAEPFQILQSAGQNPLPRLRELLSQYRLRLPVGLPPFFAGAVGYFAYDLGFLLEEKLRKLIPDDLEMPDCFFGFYNTVLAMDNFRGLLYVCAAGFPEKSSFLQKALARENFKKMQNLIAQAEGEKTFLRKTLTLRPSAEIKSNFTPAGYRAAVSKAKEYIRKGDIYQVNLSQRFQGRTALSGLQLYQRLRIFSPANFSAYFDAGAFQILSSSPERFIGLKSGQVFTRPMKGTRPRAENRMRDKKLKGELLKSAKDKAELLMIVDLERNDLGRVCGPRSVKVRALRTLEQYKTVFQTTADIRGKLRRGKDRVDLLAAAFPGGSVTGCPKIRSMQIIEELEPSRRGIYTGSFGYLSFSGEMDFNILIRTILKKQDKFYFGVGGGIVADSQPEEEYQETLVKAKAILQAVGIPN